MSLRQQPNCLDLGWPPTWEPNRPIYPHRPYPAELVPCINRWTFFWVRISQTESTKFWMFIKRIRYDLDAVEGCVLFQHQSGQPYYQYIGLYLKYVTNHLCQQQQLFNGKKCCHYIDDPENPVEKYSECVNDFDSCPTPMQGFYYAGSNNVNNCLECL